MQKQQQAKVKTITMLGQCSFYVLYNNRYMKFMCLIRKMMSTSKRKINAPDTKA